MTKTVTQTASKRSNVALTGVISALKSRIDCYTMQRRAFAELNDLSDRELDDLGLARVDLARVARDEARKAFQA